MSLATILLASIITLRGNPVAMPSVVMTAENVLISVTPETILVAGRYRFRATEDRVPNSNPEYLPFNAYFALPIPVPEATKVNEFLAIELIPELTFGQEVIQGSISGVFSELPIVSGIKFAAAHFYLKPSTVEFEVIIRYQQPVIHRDGRLFAYYVPLLPNFESNKLRYNLKEGAYAVSFEALRGSTLKLQTPRAKVLQYSPKLVSVQALHREVLEVEIFSP